MDTIKNKVNSHCISDFAKPIQDTFGFYTPELICSFSLKAGHKCSLDIIQFESMMRVHHSYDPITGESLSDFILGKFGQEAVDLVFLLIEGIDVSNIIKGTKQEDDKED